jgi:hypothetical protein
MAHLSQFTAIFIQTYVKSVSRFKRFMRGAYGR